MTNAELATLIIKAIFAVISVFLTYYIIPWFKSMYEANTNAKFKKFVNDAVKAAEQTVKESGSGAKKKEIVLDKARIWLQKNGLEMSESDLNDIIESLVFSLNKTNEVILSDN